MDSIDYTSPTYLSAELSLDGGAILDKNDSFALFLDSFQQTIKQNVYDVISQVDAEAFPIADPNNEARISTQSYVGPGDKLERKKKRTSLSPIKSTRSLQKRWERILGTEKERHRRRNRIRPNKINYQHRKPSIEKQWDEVFRRNGYCIIPRSRKEEPAFDRFGTVNDISERDKRDESLHGIHLSPIFRFQVNKQQCSIDFETLLSIEGKEDNDDMINRGNIEIQHLVFNNAINDEKKKGNDTTDVHNKAILESISLLIAMTPEDWRKYDSRMHLNVERNIGRNKNSGEYGDFHNEIRAKQELVKDDTNLNQIHNNRTKTRHFLRHVMEQKYVLTTSLGNLLLAHLVTSTDIENKEIGDGCFQIFEEMKMLAESGQYKCRPDSTTYRILILAFSRRFQGMGEAVKLSQEMVESSSIDINPELLNEALKACRAKTELSVSRLLMNSALSNRRIRINSGSCIIYTEMLKTRKLDQEAIKLFSRIKEANVLTQNEEDEYLISLCRWPQRSRRGDVLDLSSFWMDILCILEQKTPSPKIPDIRVWITFLEGLYNSAKNDNSLWKLAADATKTILDSYPRSFVGRRLMTIGLDASSYIEDPELASSILKRLAAEPSIRNSPSNLMADTSQIIMRSAKVPFRTLKNSLKICLKTSDAKSAKSIRESLDEIGDPYPVGAKSELYSLVLMCHAKINDAENAKRDLHLMIKNNMKPSEELYSEVLRTMAAAGRYQEMEELFQSMQMGQEDGIKPRVSSYDAIIFARIKEKSFDGVISLYEQMRAEGIIPSSRTVKGFIVANDQKGGRESVLSALESLLLCNAQFDESAFRLASETLFKGVNQNLDDFRKNIREIGECNKNLRVFSLDLVRSIRFAEIESSRPKISHESRYERKHSGENAWRLATSHLLVFEQAWSENKDDI